MSRVFFSRLLLLAVLLLVGVAVDSFAQDMPDASTRSGRPSRSDVPMGLKEMLARQKVERDRKDHEEMLERGEEALLLAKQLEASFAQNNGFSSQDRARLESLEKVVTKIRKELGADDDGEKETVPETRPADEPKPSTMEEAFKYLQSTTVKLVDELKKTTRFSVSVVAIQTSNNVLKLVRFLRLKK